MSFWITVNFNQLYSSMLLLTVVSVIQYFHHRLSCFHLRALSLFMPRANKLHRLQAQNPVYWQQTGWMISSQETKLAAMWRTLFMAIAHRQLPRGGMKTPPTCRRGQRGHTKQWTPSVLCNPGTSHACAPCYVRLPNRDCTWGGQASG